MIERSIVIDTTIQSIIKMIVFKRDKKSTKEREEKFEALLKILNYKGSEVSNRSLFVKRLLGKQLTYPQSKKLIKWLGSFVYPLSNNHNHKKMVSGLINGEQKEFIAICRVGGIYFDELYRNIKFDNNAEIVFKDIRVGEI